MPILTFCKTIEVKRELLSGARVWIAFMPFCVFGWDGFDSLLWFWWCCRAPGLRFYGWVFTSPLAWLEVCAFSAGNTPLSDPSRVADVLGAFAPKRGPSYEKQMTNSDPSEVNRATPILSGASPAPTRGQSHGKEMTNSDPSVGHGGQAGANTRQVI